MGDPLSVKITESLGSILKYYLEGKQPYDYLFPINYESTNRKGGE